MPSQISWLDFSEKERKKMTEVIQLFRETDTRDELGVASIRDTMAEILFPGTGTLQTRARYFLFVPWHCQRREKKGHAGNKASKLNRDGELILMNGLINNQEEGVIGQRSRENLHRFPSSIYWNGLRTWGILKFSGTIWQYYQSLNHFYDRKRAYQLLEKGGPILDTMPTNWDLDIPKPPENFPKEMDFNLTYEEAIYLKDRLQISCSKSLLSYLVRETQPVEGITFPWHHPDVQSFPDYLQSMLSDAENFSEIIWGAPLLYNYLLAQKAGLDDLVEIYRERLERWREILEIRWELIKQWDIGRFWRRITTAGRIPLSTQDFANEWVELVLNQTNIPDLSSNTIAHEIIKNREYRLKRGRSRFENHRRLEMWGGQSGTGQLNYRWQIGNQIANDILYGLNEGE